MVYTETICKQLEEIINGEDNPGIEKFNDLTGKTPYIKIYLSKNASPEKVLKVLYKNTSLQTHYGINFTSLENSRFPKIYNWKEKIDEKELNEVIQILKNNGVIIFPTETVYGIGGNALSNEVIDKVYNAKNRPRAKAVNIMVSNKNEIKKYAEITSNLEQKIIDDFLPRPLTIIL